ncbi:hypothetical protein [Chryseobacterium taklimakanense]|uniref:Type II CBASS E2 protein domain-containing protein n=1 Tax=Chryseobacterium taklimakanense TaxID=536441 RepID=A0A3G8WJD0_9FLAO|nr:hypothetical protein [Chryseobacterium taklimakanense]AZI20603.1 hypothetical protein EIH08_07640 [Chryseobacterium taklimakanense]
MNLITILEENIKKQNQKRWFPYLLVQKALVEQYFDWLDVWIDTKEKSLKGEGKLKIGDKSYSIRLSFSPFFPFRYDRIFIEDKSIKYSNDIHLYGNDLSLCLYHPVIDQPLLSRIPLFKMIPWISEWIIFYEQWKKYGVWLGKEIKHC